MKKIVNRTENKRNNSDSFSSYNNNISNTWGSKHKCLI